MTFGRSSLRASVNRAMVSGLLAIGIARSGLAQTAPAPDRAEPAVCLGFSFGPWTPPLDWRLAGHETAVDSSLVPRAPNGRGWAAPTPGITPADTTLMLFPAWWPVGVQVVLSTRPPAPGDTVSGQAFALVADGRRDPPTTRVRAWQVPCGR